MKYFNNFVIINDLISIMNDYDEIK